jgi:hypothetical protein
VSSEPVSTKSRQALVISGITAAVAVTLCALVAIAYMFGWLPASANVATPTSLASPGQQTAGTAPGVDLLPGESLVTPESAPTPAPKPAAPGPTTPRYARTAPAAAPAPRDPTPAPSPAPAPRDPKPENTSRPSAPAPKPPVYARAAPERSLCVNCGTVSAITAYADTWEVRVRFEDGATQVLRYRSPPSFRVGQRVRLEDDRLVRD